MIVVFQCIVGKKVDCMMKPALFMCKYIYNYLYTSNASVTIIITEIVFFSASCTWYKKLWIGSKLSGTAIESVNLGRVAVHQVIAMSFTNCLRYLVRSCGKTDPLIHFQVPKTTHNQLISGLCRSTWRSQNLLLPSNSWS